MVELKVTHWRGQKTWKLCHFFVTEGRKRTASRDLLKIFEFCNMFWIANNACDIVNWKNYLYLSHGSCKGSRTLMLFAGSCLRGSHLTFENVNWINLRTTVPLVSYIRNSLRFWYYASLSTCCQNLKIKIGVTGKIWEKAGVKLLRDLTEKSVNFSTLATSNIRLLLVFGQEDQ